MPHQPVSLHAIDAYEYMRPKKVLEVVPFSSATLWRKVKKGEFPKPVKLSQRITAFKRVDVYAWLKSKGAV